MPCHCAFCTCRAKAAAQAKQQAGAQAEKASQSISALQSSHPQADGSSSNVSIAHLPSVVDASQQAVALKQSEPFPEEGPAAGRAAGPSNHCKPSKQGRSQTATRQGHGRSSAAAGQFSEAHGKAENGSILEHSSSGTHGRDLGKPRILEVRRPTRHNHVGPPGVANRAHAKTGSVSIASTKADKAGALDAEPASQQLQTLS